MDSEFFFKNSSGRKNLRHFIATISINARKRRVKTICITNPPLELYISNILTK
jgi:hypothetical protein